MKIFKVGGAVRDTQMGLKPKDTDWVVVGSSPEEMIEKGFKQVGKNFPVFLHPKTNEEYALARKDRKIEYSYLMAHEMGKPISQAESEIEKCIWLCDYYFENAAQFLEDEIINDNAQKYIITNYLDTC